jgi:hypothetical protein
VRRMKRCFRSNLLNNLEWQHMRRKQAGSRMLDGS